MMPVPCPGDADADLVVGAADPVELGRVELRALVAEQRIEAGAAADDAEGRAVLGADIVEPVGEPQAAGALHVLRHDVRIAGNVLAHVAREHARIEVVAAADAVADIEIDGLALVEVGHALRAAARGGDKQEGRGQRPRVNTSNTMFLPLERSPLCGGCIMRPLSSPQDCFDKNTGYGAATIRRFCPLGPRSKEQAK